MLYSLFYVFAVLLAAFACSHASTTFPLHDVCYFFFILSHTLLFYYVFCQIRRKNTNNYANIKPHTVLLFSLSWIYYVDCTISQKQSSVSTSPSPHRFNKKRLPSNFCFNCWIFPVLFFSFFFYFFFFVSKNYLKKILF